MAAAMASSARDSSSSSVPTSTTLSATRPKPGANGVSARSAPESDGVRRESNTPDLHSHDRFLYLLGNCIGCSATVTVKSGELFQGIFSGASLEPFDSRYVLKMVRKVSGPTVNGSGDHPEYSGYGDDFAMTFSTTDVVDLSVQNVTPGKSQSKVPNGTSSSFRTDTDISGNLAPRQKELKPWQPAPDDNLEANLTSGGGGQHWDQFETNERLYGVRSDYDENYYTTALDRSHPTYKQRAAQADKIAREIEKGGSQTAQDAENDDGDEDEEAKFSGVKREYRPLTSSNPNAYTPPARRPPTGQVTVPGAPVDPAIISSQLSKPEKTSDDQTNIRDTSSAVSSVHTTKDSPIKQDLSTSSSSNPGQGSTIADKTKLTDKTAPLSATSITATSNKSNSGQSSKDHSSGDISNASATVEKDLLRSFKNFSANEKIKVKNQRQQTNRHEREIKFNDLKKFSENFKLKTEVPKDMLGILAKDRERQDEIYSKAKRQAEEQVVSAKSTAIPPSEPSALRSSGPNTSSRAEAATRSQHAGLEHSSGRGRGGHGPRGRSDRAFQASQLGIMGARGAGQPTLGQQLMSRAPYGSRGQVPPGMPMQTPGPIAIPTDAMAISRSSGISTPTSANAPRFNAQAIEFRPNAAATSFTPTSSSSPAPPKTEAKSRPKNRVSFFGDKRPGPLSEKKSMKEGFNTIKRLKLEVEKDGKTKDFAANGGIPQAYRTPPTWDVREENQDKSYVDMLEIKPSMGKSASPANTGIPHQHQLPMHLQPAPQGMPPMHQQAARQSFGPIPHGPRAEQMHEDHRMTVSSANQSMYSSPRFQHSNMMPHMSPMYAPAQPAYGQPQQGYVMQHIGPNGQPVRYIQQMPGGQQFPGPQGGQMNAQPMMGGPPGNFVTVPFQPQHVQMYSPAPNPAFPAHMSGPQTPSGFSGPHAAPMMSQRGSQQGQGPTYMYMSHSQQGQQPYGQPMQQPPMMPMRGGMPMQQQPSYGASPHMQGYFPSPQHAHAQQHRGNHVYGGGGHQYPPHQQMPPPHAMPHVQQHGPPQAGPNAMPNQSRDHSHEDVK